MREIKFRAIHTLTKHWFDDIHIIYQDGEWFEDYRALEDGRPMNLDQVAIMQYTGLKDKNGTEIYEGDIVKGDYYDETDTKRIIGKIEYNKPEYKVNGVNQYEGLRVRLYGNCEVIGNIYEHKHLLEGVDK